MKKLSSLVQEIRFVEIGEPPDSYIITLEIPSFIRKQTHSHTTQWHKFIVSISLPKEYPDKQAPVCKIDLGVGSKTPFHHHFSDPLFASPKWIDYRKYDKNEGLANFVLRIAHSLNFEEKYIQGLAETIANPEALSWYHDRIRTDSDMFPITKEILPTDIQSISINLSKKFEVNTNKKQNNITKEKKKFKVIHKTEPYQPELGAPPDLKIVGEASTNQSLSQKFHMLLIKLNECNLF